MQHTSTNGVIKLNREKKDKIHRKLMMLAWKEGDNKTIIKYVILRNR